MNISSFIKQATANAGQAEMVLKKYQAFLNSFTTVQPLMTAWDKGELLPTPCLTQVLQLLSTYLHPEEEEKSTKSSPPEIPSRRGQKESKVKQAKTIFYITIFIKDGNTISAIDQTLEEKTWSGAERLADRRLFDRADALYAEIVHQLGEKIFKNKVYRSDAIARILKRGKGPVCTGGSKKTTKRLGFGVKASNSRTHFSGC